jgi:hypothetical protein
MNISLLEVTLDDIRKHHVTVLLKNLLFIDKDADVLIDLKKQKTQL